MTRTKTLAPALVALVLTFAPASLSAQPAPPAAGTPAPAAPEPAANAAIPLAEVPDRAESAATEIRAAQAELAQDAVANRIAASLSPLVREIDALEQDTNRATRGDASLTVVQGLAARWQKVRDTLGEARHELSARTARIEKERAHLADLEKQWKATLALAQAPDAPAAVRARVQSTLRVIDGANAALDRQQGDVIAVLDRIAQEDGRVNAALASLDAARDRAVSRLLTRQNPPIWQPDAIERATLTVTEAQQDTIAAELDRLADYARGGAETLISHAFVIVMLAAMLFAVRSRVHVRAQTVPALAHTVKVLDTPIASALVLAVLGSHWLYADAPRSFTAILDAAALISTVVILRRIADRRLFPILYAVMVFYVVDQIRVLAATLAVTSRLLFIAEMLAGALFALYLSRGVTRGELKDAPLPRWTRRGAWLVCALFFAAAAANALGFTSLADLIERSVLGSAYAGVILYAAVLIIDGLVLLALYSRPLVLSQMVRTHTERMWGWIRRLVRWVAIFYWVWLALDRLTLLDRVLDVGRAALDTDLKIGSLEITVGHLFTFGITVWAAFLLSRLTRFILEEDVFTRVYLPSGLPYAITRTTHYLILIVGFLMALATLGVDMTKFTILIGALTVGIGFGLQNIINNFVSGIILLFERPVKVGDVIQMEDQVGVVKRIGIRASVIRTASGADVILPNGKFISDRVTNWTRATNYRPIEISLAVGGTANAREVMALLVRVAGAQPGVVKSPPPEAQLAKIGGDMLNFDLRVWTDRAEEWTRVRSDVTVALNEALNAAQIAIK